jgi:hypothetical protein
LRGLRYSSAARAGLWRDSLDERPHLGRRAAPGHYA